jgi:hypothetical protein
MKKVILASNLLLLLLTVSSCFTSCKKDSDSPGDSGGVPTNGWRIGTTNYTKFMTMRNVAGANTISAFDAFPTSNNLNTAVVLFNNVTGIAAGTFKVVFRANQSDLLADEIMVAANTGYNQSTSQYDKQYATVAGQTVNATVTITSGKATIVVPQINIVSYPVTSSSINTTFAGTIAE